MRLSRLVAMVMRTAVVAGIACLLSLGTTGGSASASVRAGATDGASDKAVALVKKVHQASLVEMWAGERAQKFGVSPAVKWVGRGLLNDHIYLEKKVKEAAQQMNIKLPAEPDLQQQAGIRKMARVTGQEFDLAFANTLHFGHSLVLPMAKAVVAENSSNPLVRSMGTLGVTFVSKHIAWLEATGLVTTSSSAQAAAQAQAARVSAEVQPYSNVLPAMVGLGSLGLLLITVAYLVLRPRRSAAPASRRGGQGSRAAGGSSRSRVASHAR
jgi:predicted outer membrane protein